MRRGRRRKLDSERVPGSCGSRGRVERAVALRHRWRPLEQDEADHAVEHQPASRSSAILPLSLLATEMTSQVRVGVGCFLFNSKLEFVVGVRKGSHGAGAPGPSLLTQCPTSASLCSLSLHLKGRSSFQAGTSKSASRPRRARCARSPRRRVSSCARRTSASSRRRTTFSPARASTT